jgi:hypothetical protein
MWYKVSGNFQGNVSKTNKTFFLDLTTTGITSYGGRFFVSAEGIGQNPLWHEARFQGGEAAQVAHKQPNLVSQSHPRWWVTRDRWERWEFKGDLGTPGLFDGTLEWWVNGVKIMTYIDINYSKSTHLGTVAQFKWQPIWGGGGEIAPHNMWQWINEVYMEVL